MPTLQSSEPHKQPVPLMNVMFCRVVVAELWQKTLARLFALSELQPLLTPTKSGGGVVVLKCDVSVMMVW